MPPNTSQVHWTASDLFITFYGYIFPYILLKYARGYENSSFLVLIGNFWPRNIAMTWHILVIWVKELYFFFLYLLTLCSKASCNVFRIFQVWIKLIMTSLSSSQITEHYSMALFPCFGTMILCFVFPILLCNELSFWSFHPISIFFPIIVNFFQTLFLLLDCFTLLLVQNAFLFFFYSFFFFHSFSSNGSQNSLTICNSIFTFHSSTLASRVYVLSLTCNSFYKFPSYT